MSKKSRADDRWSVEVYEALAAFVGDWRDSWWNTDFLALMARRWRLDDVASMLDVGCGVGHWGQRLARFLPNDARVEGVDIEPAFVEQAEQRAAERGDPQTFRYASAGATELPFADGTFDMVTCQTLLIHVPDVEVVLREMLRVLRPGGLLAAVEPNNLANSLIQFRSHPRMSWIDAAELLRLQETCERGKIATGHGDSSVGDLLPGLVATVGCESIQTYTSDRTPAWFPPYAGDDVATDMKQWFSYWEHDISMMGRRQDAEKVFAAGGGDPAEFDGLWAKLMARQREVMAQVRAGDYHAARGFVMYLVSGRKPE